MVGLLSQPRPSLNRFMLRFRPLQQIPAADQNYETQPIRRFAAALAGCHPAAAPTGAETTLKLEGGIGDRTLAIWHFDDHAIAADRVGWGGHRQFAIFRQFHTASELSTLRGFGIDAKSHLHVAAQIITVKIDFGAAVFLTAFGGK